MNIQIFGTKKSSDTRKAERFFKERGIKFQFVDLKEKAMSKGEFQSVLQAVGGLEDVEVTNRGFMEKSFLDNHYDSILAANREKILAGGTSDPLLENALTDSRMSLVVLIRISPDAAERINCCIDDLKGFEPNLYYYPAKDFHITVMDVLKGEEGREIPPNINEYIRCIEECSKDISPFKIKFDGLTASDNAVLVRGYYDDQLMVFRQKLRDMLKQRGLSLEERYKTISSHVTIARLHGKFQNPERLLDYIEKPRLFGTMTVSNMEISFHNWYDTRKEVLSLVEFNSSRL